MASQENDDEIQRFLPFLLWTRQMYTHSDSVPSQCWKYCSFGSEATFSSYVLSRMVIFGFEILFSFVIVATCIGLMFHHLQWWWDMWILSGRQWLGAGGADQKRELIPVYKERWWWWSSWCRGVDFKLVWVCDQWVSEFVWRCDKLSSILFSDGFVEADLLLLWCS